MFCVCVIVNYVHPALYLREEAIFRPVRDFLMAFLRKVPMSWREPHATPSASTHLHAWRASAAVPRRGCPPPRRGAGVTFGKKMCREWWEWWEWPLANWVPL